VAAAAIHGHATVRRREFLQGLVAAAVAGLPIDAPRAANGERLYDALQPFGNVGLLHITDCHGQLNPTRFREPSVNIGIGSARGKPPHLVGEALLRHFGIAPGTRAAHAFTHLDFERAARVYGAMGGFAHICTLVKRLRARRPGALLLDGGDSWQGSATSLWTRGQDMVDAARLLGVDVMTGHWEFTYGAQRVKEVVDGDFAGRIDFIAQNVRTADFGDPVFEPYVIKTINGIPVAIVGQAFPYTPIANPRYFVPDWTFGIQEESMQKAVDSARGKGAHAVVLLSHNGMDVDLKLASRVTGIDVILGGHTHDGVPQPTIVSNRAGKTVVTNAGCNGKFIGVLDLEVGEKNAEIAFSPGFRWGTTLLPGQTITREHLMGQTAITYPYVTSSELTGQTIKTILEDVADNLFHPDPYYQQGGDMVRVGGMRYTIDPTASIGHRVSRMELDGKPIDADRKYKVAGWAPVSEEAKAAGGEAIWDVIERYLRDQKTIKPRTLNLPALAGVAGDPGIDPTNS